MLMTESLMSPFTVTLTLNEVGRLGRASFLSNQPAIGMESSIPARENLFLQPFDQVDVYINVYLAMQHGTVVRVDRQLEMHFASDLP